jgi:prophage regulatory protein
MQSHERHYMESNKYARLTSVCERYGISPATIWRKARQGTFPKPHKLSPGISAWKESQLIEWEKDPLNYKAKL